ncbi:AAA family ATPase [Ralstonia nicotianae]
MRLKQLDLFKYGKFTDTALSFPKAANDFHVIVGPNEAGKSTLRTAISELLFGMKLQTPLDFLHGTSELRLGGVLESDVGETVFHRARGRNSLRSPSDEKLPDDYLAALLGGASKEFFEQMFGLDHERLVEGGKSILNASDKLGQVLFESAAGVRSLGTVREDLESRAGELWAPRRSNSEFALAEASFNDAAAELKMAQVRTRDWVERKEALDAVNQEIEQARSEQLRLDALRSRLERVRRLAPSFTELVAKETTLKAMGEVVELSPAAYSDLLKAQGDIAADKRVLAERRHDLSVKQAERDALEADSDAIALSGEIEALEKLRNACLTHQRDLPLRQAEVGRHLTAAASAAAQLNWPTNEVSLRAALPTALALRTVTSLLREHGALYQALISAEEALDEKERDLAELQDQVGLLTIIAIPETLRAVLSTAQGFKGSDVKELSLERSVAAAERALNEALAKLGRWCKSVQELRALDLPSLARLSALQKDESERAGSVAVASQALDKAREDVETLQFQEKHFTENNKVVTAAEVLAARASRDGAWGKIKAGALSIESGAPVLDGAIRLADELVDSQLGTTQAAATLQALRQRIELAEAELRRKETSLSEHERELANCNDEWERFAVAAGLPGMPLADMSAWLALREAVFVAQGGLELQQRELADARATRVAAQTALLAALRGVSLGGEPDDLPVLIATAESLIQSAERTAAQKDSLADHSRQVERARSNAQGKLTLAQAAYDGWKEQWRDALEAAKLAAVATTLAAAEGAVEIANSIAADLAAVEDPKNRILAMNADLSALEAEGRRLADALAPELSTLENWFDVARQLTARLATAKEASKAIERADEAVRQAKMKVTDAETTVAGAEARVRPILQLASAESIESALPLAERSDQHRAIVRDIEHAKATIIRDGDGLSQEAIAIEVSEYEIAQVPALLEKAKQDLAAVGDALSSSIQKQVTVKQAFEAINGQANAALAEAKRQEALTTMGEVAEQYLEAATASRLLKWATDRYREQKQGPMLKRAGEIFADLTIGEFSRLTVDAEVDPPKLYAKRRNGKTVEVAGLSEGTRDQLFLALRIAALELQIESKGALPFVADDLLINFDNDRAKAGLRALRDLSAKTQVLFLTHHDHLLPLVKEVFGEQVSLAELQREASVA